VFGDDGDVAAVLEDGELDFVGAAAAGGAECGVEFVDGHADAVHGLHVGDAVVDEDDGAAFDDGFEEFGFEGEEADEVVEGDECAGGDDAAGDGVVAAVHGVLDGVGEDEEEDEVEGGELADLSFAGEAEDDEDEDVDDDAAEDEVPPGEGGVPDELPVGGLGGGGGLGEREEELHMWLLWDGFIFCNDDVR
jgi:hypothetical protein